MALSRHAALTWAAYRNFWEAWADNYLCSPGWWRIDGRPIVALNNIHDFAELYGRVIFSAMLRYASHIVSDRVRAPLFLLGVIGQANSANIEIANELPLDGLTGYGLLPNWLGAPVQDYEALIDQRTREWDHLQARLRIPFYPVVCAGWDATVRGAFRGRLRGEDGYPYSPVVSGVTPELFGAFLDAALAFNDRWQPRLNLVFLHAWNEWTEASVLEPSDRFGTAMLDEVWRRSRRFAARPITEQAQ